MMFFLLTSNSFLSILANKRRQNLADRLAQPLTLSHFFARLNQFLVGSFAKYKTLKREIGKAVVCAVLTLPTIGIRQWSDPFRQKKANQMKNPQQDATNAPKINKNMVLSCCKGTLNFLNEAKCSLSILRDSLDRIMEESEKEKDLFLLKCELYVFAKALKFFYNGFSETYSDLASWTDAFEEGEGA